MTGVLCALLVGGLLPGAEAARETRAIELTVHPDTEEARISPLIYGQCKSNVTLSLPFDQFGTKVRSAATDG